MQEITKMKFITSAIHFICLKLTERKRWAINIAHLRGITNA
jgi:hypothetical protein